MEQKDLEGFNSLQGSATCRRIDFQKADVRPGFVSGTYILIVCGEKPWVTMKVELKPLVYIDKPEYWGIEVIGCQSGIGLPQTAPYEVALEITQYIGNKGIEVIGNSVSKKIDVP